MASGRKWARGVEGIGRSRSSSRREGGEEGSRGRNLLRSGEAGRGGEVSLLSRRALLRQSSAKEREGVVS